MSLSTGYDGPGERGRFVVSRRFRRWKEENLHTCCMGHTSVALNQTACLLGRFLRQGRPLRAGMDNQHLRRLVRVS